MLGPAFIVVVIILLLCAWVETGGRRRVKRARYRYRAEE